jgi:hypothetical protein
MTTLIEPKIPEAEGNDEFAKWVEQWIAGIEQSRILAEQIPKEKTTIEDRQRHSAYRDPTTPDNE